MLSWPATKSLRHIGKEKAIELMEYVDQINCINGGMNTRLYVNENISKKKFLQNDLHLLSAKVRHLGTDVNQIVLANLYEYLKDRVCIGQGFRGKSGELGVGECTGYFRNNVPGCPPDTERSYRYLKEYCEKQKSLFRG